LAELILDSNNFAGIYQYHRWNFVTGGFGNIITTILTLGGENARDGITL